MAKKKSAGARPGYSEEQKAELERLEGALKAHMEEVKPRRYAHSLSVAQTAESLALTYGVDPFEARAAGILHDWHKVYPASEQIERARALGMDLGVDLHLVSNLLHGMLTARELPERFPELPVSVWQAIDRHTTAAADMSPLDMVVFVADGIEPLRKSTPGIEHSRSLVGKASLDDLFWESFLGGVISVLQPQRYLYPGTLDIYNQLALRRSGKEV